VTESTGRSAWQRTFIEDLESLTRTNSDLIRICGQRKLDEHGNVPLTLELRTGTIAHVEGGLSLEALEQVEVLVPRTPTRPPAVHVLHPRFLGFPHVLHGLVLCIYLDASREWNPGDGAQGFLNRLWGWFESAAGARFNPHTALFHAIGGTGHYAEEAPTAVVRKELPERWVRVGFVLRSPRRYDLEFVLSGEATAAPLWHAPAPLPLGVGTSVNELAGKLDDPTSEHGGKPIAGIPPRRELLWTTLRAAAKRNSDGQPQPFVLSVPHPNGGAPHVLVGAVDSKTADALRSDSDVDDARILWWSVSDERPSVTTRRDSSRPTKAFVGRTVLLFGCGGLGSWMADYIVRSGVGRLYLSDPAAVTGGLLVRQNYEEMDVGWSKEVALQRRLSGIRDDVDISVVEDFEALDLNHPDLIIDASVNLALGQALSKLSPDVTLAQVSVDPGTGSHGMLIVKAIGSETAILDLDAAVGAAVQDDPSLEEYHPFWSGSDANSVIPTRGCSVPTFHGSAADLAAAAGVMVSLLGTHLLKPVTGVHLFALPHAGTAGGRSSVFIPYP
jgi:hypothetical protein